VSDIEFEMPEDVGEHDLELPATLPILALKDTVVFPQSMMPLAIGQERSIRLIDDVVAGDRFLALVTAKDASIDAPGFDDIYDVGTVAVVHKMLKIPDGTLRILVGGLHRVKLAAPVGAEPYLVGEFEALPDTNDDTPEVEALTRNVQGLFAKIIGLSPYLPAELQLAATNVDDPSALAHLVASTLRTIPTEERQQLLEEPDVEQRLRHVSAILSREADVLELGSKIQSQVQSEMEKGQREYFLRQQLKAIQAELGEGDPEQAEVNELRERFEQIKLPEDVRKAAERELGRLERLPTAAAEYGVIRTYLEWVISLPWDAETEDNLDLDHARGVLDKDHFDLEKVKERIVEHLAVAKLRNEISGQILCFVGPPGVGKTSLGQSIAKALGRKFVRMSVGGVRDEAEIRGHRRTYIGAMPGTIVRSLRDAESRNPVLLIDEIDKMGSDYRGDPSSAMLEVLDPEQNRTFRDHYLDLPFDLSKVLFICTANTLDTIPGPLLDRMDTIELSGYTEAEKLAIAKRYLLPKQLEAAGLKRSQLSISDTVLRTIIREYTREAGVRSLERRLADVCRKAATQVARGKTQKTRVDDKRLREWLGPRRFSGEVRKRTSHAGVATGLAYTPAGGDVLFIEAAAYPGKGDMIVTGQLGDVMKESAKAALSWVRSHTTDLGVPEKWFEEHDIHIHVPAGAVPKDGPSAGVTIATAIASLVREERVADDVGMTGEITLTGQVLPIGGIREKSLAAQRAGLKRVILPRENENDLSELPPEVRDGLEFIPADTVEDVFAAAFDGVKPARGRRGLSSVDRQAARGG
jgi:ATP-dependent Lon protease